ncbi:MAG: glycoside hydrolase family 32 protein [Allomuricauda sp.]
MKNKMILMAVAMVVAFQFFSCKDGKTKQDLAQIGNGDSLSGEEVQYRPYYHFTPKVGWMNDPNGMFYYNGYYHLFYQHYPEDNVWGPMHWGHAISTDLVQWKHLPIALYPDDLGYIFSGSAVVDYDNTSGFGKDGKIPIVVMYTYHDPKKADAGRNDAQTQAIAYSLDEGNSWTKYEGNPVIDNPGIRDFRDPKVTWDQERQQWVMILAADFEMMLYTSKNLKDWVFVDRFGKDTGSHEGVWECPDFFPLQVEGTDEVKWVMLASISGGAPNGGNGTQYFIGDFDGQKFTMDKNFEAAIAKEHDFWVDFGKDNYAGVTWSNIPPEDGRKIFIGWIVDGHYANKVPTSAWRSSQSIPRTVKLISENGVPRITFQPVDEITRYIGKKYKKDELSIGKAEEKILEDGSFDFSKAQIKYSINSLRGTGYTFELSNDKGEELRFGYDAVENNFFVDRRKSGKVDFHKEFAEKISIGPRLSQKDSHNADILLDKTSIELFFDDGETVMTEIFFPSTPYSRLSVTAENGALVLDDLEINQLKFN